MPGANFISRVANKGLPLMAFEGLFNTALKGTWHMSKGLFKTGKTGVSIGQYLPGMNIVKGAASQVPAGLMNNAKVADRIAGETADVLMRQVGKEAGTVGRLKDAAHIAAVNGIPIGAIAAGATMGSAGAKSDLALGGINITGLAGSINMGATPGLEMARKGIYGGLGNKVDDALNYGYRNGESLDEMLNGGGGDLALSLSGNSRGGGF